MPILLYDLEVCCLNKTELNSLDFVINHFCMKLFRTSNMDVVKDCQVYVKLILHSELLSRLYEKFLLEMSFSNNVYSCALV